MALISYAHTRWDAIAQTSIYTIVDSEFGSIEVDGAPGRGFGIVIAREYAKRGLPVGKNLALLAIFQHKFIRESIANILSWQDTEAPKYVEGWDRYAKERDEHLTKLLALL